MNTRTWNNVLSIVRQLRRIGRLSCGWLSDSGKGIKECTGIYRCIERTARGLAITLHTGRRVCWRVSQIVADRVLTYWHTSTREMEATDLAISLAMNKAKFDGITDDCAVNAACEVYVNADCAIVRDVLTSWV